MAARNPRFEGHTLADAKKLMGTLQHTDKAAWLPHKPVEQNVRSAFFFCSQAAHPLSEY